MVDYALLTNVGDREVNEDCVGMIEVNGRYCFILCDGLGGHDKGEVASQMVVESIKSDFSSHNGREEDIAEYMRSAQTRLLSKQREMNEIEGMKTTAVVLCLNEYYARYTHIGDSRGYYFFKQKYKNHTLDHSVPQMLVSAHKIKDKDIRNHPDRNRVLKVMGTEWEADSFEVGKAIARKSGKNQAFLMCTDGFWELICEEDMVDCLKKSRSAKEWLGYMQDIVMQNGTGRNMDNYSAIAVITED